MLGTTAWVKIKNSQFITVKGSARKNIESDLVVWTGSFTAEAPTLLEAQHKTQSRRARKSENFLGGDGVTNLVFKPIALKK